MSYAEVLEPSPYRLSCLQDTGRWQSIAQLLRLPLPAQDILRYRYTRALTTRGNLFVLMLKHRVAGVMFVTSYSELPAVKIHRCAFSEGVQPQQEKLLIERFISRFRHEEIIVTSDNGLMSSDMQERLQEEIKGFFAAHRLKPAERLGTEYRQALQRAEDPLVHAGETSIIRFLFDWCTFRLSH